MPLRFRLQLALRAGTCLRSRLSPKLLLPLRLCIEKRLKICRTASSRPKIRMLSLPPRLCTEQRTDLCRTARSRTKKSLTVMMRGGIAAMKMPRTVTKMKMTLNCVVRWCEACWIYRILSSEETAVAMLLTMAASVLRRRRRKKRTRSPTSTYPCTVLRGIRCHHHRGDHLHHHQQEMVVVVAAVLLGRAREKKERPPPTLRQESTASLTRL